MLMMRFTAFCGRGRSPAQYEHAAARQHRTSLFRALRERRRSWGAILAVFGAIAAMSGTALAEPKDPRLTRVSRIEVGSGAEAQWDAIVEKLARNGDWVAERELHAATVAGENERYIKRLFKMRLGFTKLDKRIGPSACVDNTQNCIIQYVGEPKQVITWFPRREGEPLLNPLVGIWGIVLNYDAIWSQLPEAAFANQDGCQTVLRVGHVLPDTLKNGLAIQKPHVEVVAAYCTSWTGTRFVIWREEEDGRVVGEREPERSKPKTRGPREKKR